MTVLIDSWTWIWKGGRHVREAQKYIEGDEDAHVSTINLLEVYSWVAKYYDENVAIGRIDTMGRRCYVVPVEKVLSLDAAKLKIKYKLGIADSIILATSRHVNGKLVTGDPDFKNMEGVIFIG
jgi:predicted nucleic acid-binding protein